MKPPLNEALCDALREAGRATSLEELKRRGLGQVHSLSTAQLSRLIEMAVNRTLLKRAAGAGDNEHRELVEGVEGELRRLLRAHLQLEETRGRVTAVRRELEQDLDGLSGGGAAAPALGRALAQVEARASGQLEARLRELFAEQRAGRAAPEETEARAIVAARAALDQTAREAAQVAVESQRRRTGVLERRIRKVLRFLRETEEALAGAARNLDQGIPSAYREVQGLAEEDPQRLHKLELLREIFTANLRLAARATHGDGPAAAQ